MTAPDPSPPSSPSLPSPLSPPSPSSPSPPRMRFDLVKTSVGVAGGASGPRLGRLVFPSRQPAETPDYVAVTSRGAVPHLTPDNLAAHVRVAGTYLALEDFLERPQKNSPKRNLPPLLQNPWSPSPSSGRSTTTTTTTVLHSFTATPSHLLTLLAPRRIQAVAAPTTNCQAAPDAISIFTSTGFQPLTTAAYHAAVRALRPDLAVPMADLTYLSTLPPARRAVRMIERTEGWLRAWLADDDGAATTTGTATFAPILPTPYPLQRQYLDWLAGNDHYGYEGVRPDQLAGLAFCGSLAVDVLPDLQQYPHLLALPRLALLTGPASSSSSSSTYNAADGAPPSTPTASMGITHNPHHILRHIALGIDLFATNLVNNASDAGVAFTFKFPPPPPPPPSPSLASRDCSGDVSLSGPKLLPLGINMWAETATKSSQADNGDTAQGQPIPPLPAEKEMAMAADTSPLLDGCACPACTRHHRAYVHHLLHAREMLGWTLLQLHNHAVMTAFFAGVRRTLAVSFSSTSEPASSSSSSSLPSDGSSPDVDEISFEEAHRRFARAYEPELPHGTGDRPRARGYHFKSEGGDRPRNRPGWSKFEVGEEGENGEG